MRLPPFLTVVLVIIRIPFYLLIHVLSNVAKYVAPRTTFELAMEIFDKVKVRNYTEKIKGVDDVDFLFSWDIKQVCFSSSTGGCQKFPRGRRILLFFWVANYFHKKVRIVGVTKNLIWERVKA